jgi:chaperone BCS1
VIVEFLIDFIRDQIAHNQLFTGGAVLMVGGAILHYCRTLPHQGYHRVKSWLITEIEVPDHDQAFDWIVTWLAQHPYGRRARLLTVSTIAPKPDDDDDDQPVMVGGTAAPTSRRPEIVFSPAPGTHYFFYHGRLVMLERQRSEKEITAATSINTASAKGYKRESFIIKVFSRDRSIAQQLIADARNVAIPEEDDRLTLHHGRHDYWQVAGKRYPRPIESVVLKAGQMEMLLADMEKFLVSRKWYIERGIPYRRGYLLHGPPGSGKSSAVVALASKLRMNIATITLSGSSMGDDDLRSLMATTPNGAVILIEDIDCVFTERKASSTDSKVTFSGLLNAIDGVAAGEGRMLFMTTNHPNKLDPALIRPGRADVHAEIGVPDREQMQRLFLRFFPNRLTDSLAFATLVPEGVSMAALQGHLMQHDTPEKAIDNVSTLQR